MLIAVRLDEVSFNLVTLAKLKKVRQIKFGEVGYEAN